MRPIVKIIESALSDVKAEFMYGHPLEIVNRLSQKKYDKFPVIMLFQDFEETMREDGYVDASLHFVIANRTKPTYRAPERYEQNFEPILYPLLDCFESAIKASRDIETKTLSYTKTDRLYWGNSGLYGNTGNVFNDHIDAIEITNLSLTFKHCN